MQITEGSLTFSFNDRYTLIKFDNTLFYRKYFNGLPNAKGIDFIADSDKDVLMVEIKNYTGHEAQNRWRTLVDHRKMLLPINEADESFDIEISKKVAMTISCLTGALTKSNVCEASNELLRYFSSITDKKIITGKKKIKVILFLDGNFEVRTRTNKMIMNRIQDSLKSKLAWLYCDVQVVNSYTVNKDYFQVI